MIEIASQYRWKANQQKDDTIVWQYDLEKLSEKLFYLRDSWLNRQEKPSIMVTGANSWLGHYLLYVLTQNIGMAEILALDTIRPEYLDNKRYSTIQYWNIQRYQTDLKNVILSFHPQIIFHAHYIWESSCSNLLHLSETNVGEIELICSIANDNGINRVILFSDFSIYGNGAGFASEDTPLEPCHRFGESFCVAEKIAQKYHSSEKTQIYHLRIAPLLSHETSIGIMPLIKMMYDGLLFGHPMGLPDWISLCSLEDVALAGFLLALAPDPGYRVFNVSSEPIALKEILRICNSMIPKKNILGFPSKLANIMKIGYQEDIEIPKSLLQIIGRLSYHSTNFLNQLRWHLSKPLLTEKTVEYILGLRGLSNKRMFNNLGWAPMWNESQFIYFVQHACQNIWNRSIPFLSPELHQHRALLDDVTSMVDAIRQYSPDRSEQLQYLKVPLFSMDIDIKSLWILIDRLWNFFGITIVYGKNASQFNGQFFQKFSKIVDKILLMIRHEHDRSQRMFQTTQERICWLAQQIGSINRPILQRYASIIILEELFLQIQAVVREYGQLIQLLPDKGYGLFLASEVGDVGIIFRVTDGKVLVEFPRQELDSISRAWYFPKRLLEFQKLTKLHIVLGVRIERLFSDLISGNFLRNFRHNLGKEYVLSDTSQHYYMIGEAVHKSKINTYIFLNSNNQAEFGVQNRDKKISMLGHQYIEMINTMIEQISDYNEIIRLVSQATEGKEEIAIFKIQTIRKLLAGVIAPSRFKKVIFKLLQRAAKWQ